MKAQFPKRGIGFSSSSNWFWLRRSYYLLLLFFSQANPAIAQVTLSGLVRDSLTHKPLPFASVFLANTTHGVITDAQGHYTLSQVPTGHYNLTATYLGYKVREYPVTVGVVNLTAELNLMPTNKQLPEVIVRPNPNRAADYQRFLELFLGTSSLAKQCRVRDPEAVRVDYDAEQQVLTASVPHALEIDNWALGYRLTFYDLDFRVNFSGSAVFTTTLSHLVFRPLPGGRARQRRWAANRQQAYLGSQMHFLRCVYANTTTEAGFRLQRMRRVPNKRRAAADSMLRAQQQKLGTAFRENSVPDSVWQLLRQPRALTILYSPLLPAPAYRQTVDDRIWLRYSDLLAVTYERAKPDRNYQQGSTQSLSSEQASILNLRAKPAELTPKGQTVDPVALIAEGYWAFTQMGDLLPTDYESTI